MLLKLKTLGDALRVFLKIFQQVGLRAHLEPKQRGLTQFGKRLQPVSRQNHVAGIAEFKKRRQVINDDRIQINEQCNTLNPAKIRSSDSSLTPHAGHIDRHRAL